MSCNQFGFDVIGDDANQTLRKRIVNVAKGNDQKAIILAGYVNSGEFLIYVKEQVDTDNAIEKLLDVDNNTLEQLLNSYFIAKHPKSIEHTIMDNQSSSIFGFDNAVTKSLAKSYCANLINSKTVEEAKKPKGERLTKADIIRSVIKEINTKFVKDVFTPFAKKLRDINNPNANKSLDELNTLIKSLKTASAEEKIDIQKRIKVIQLNLINTYGNIREKNYGNLVSLVAQSPDKWFNEVFTHSSLTNITRDFEDVLNDESIFDGAYLDVNDSVEKDDGGVNQMSKNWNEHLSKSFTKLVNDDIKIYLNTIQRLNSTKRDDNGNYDLDQDNSLGVPTTYGANYLIVQLTNMDFWSLDAFIDSVKRAAEHRPGLQGLIKIANDCKENRRFGYYLMSQVNNPKIAKIQFELLEDATRVDQSNKSINASTAMINDLLNSIKSTYKTLYSDKDIDEISKKITDLNKVKVEILSANKVDELNDYILDILVKYLPKIDIAGVRGYFSEINGSKKSYIEFLTNIKQLISSIETVLDSINEESLRVSKAKRKNKDFVEAGILSGISPQLSQEDKDAAVFNYANIKYSAFNTPIINIVDKIIKYSTIRTELNSTNAEGNMSSDTINNCYITNLIRQIEYGTTEEQYAGLERLKDFITKSDQFKYSPIYFGIRNDKGGLLQRGLFERNPNTGVITINPNAKALLNISLFDGIKDRALNKGLLYDGMSKGDYFLAQIDAYWNPVRHNSLLTEKEGDIREKYAGYFMRTPSDSPKNFVIQSAKCNIDGLFTISSTEANNYVQAKAKELEDLIKIKLRTAANVNRNSNSEVVWANRNNKSYSKNIVSVEDIYNIITDTPANKGYNGLIAKYDKTTNKVYLPLIVKTSNGDCIVWLEGDKIQGIVENRMENVTIKEIYAEDENAIKNILNDNKARVINSGIKEGLVAQQLDKNHKLFRAFYQVLYGELNNFIENLNNVFTVKLNKATLRKDTKDLFEKAHYNVSYNEKGEPQYIVEGKYLKWDKDPDKRKLNPNVGKLSGNFFKFVKLFEANGYNVNESIIKMLSLYGGVNALLTPTKTAGLKLNNKHSLIEIKDNRISLNDTKELRDSLNEIVENWLVNFSKEIINRTEQYSTVLQETTYTSDNVQEAIINGALMEMNFDELFEGDSKYYKDAQEFLKRAKESQAGGKAYGGYSLNDEIGGSIKDLLEDKITIKGREILLPRRGTSGIVNDSVLYARNGFRAVTIVNTIKPSEYAPAIKKELIKELSKQFDKDKAEEMANAIAKGYYENTKVNDAQSYITFEEFITRRYLDGTLDQYEDLINQILDVREGRKDISELDLNGINSRIQVQKNFYYDIQFDNVTGCYYPRQIKNAEFVLIPELIKGTDLEKLYNIMRANDIGQVNTAETSKAAKRNVLTFWDNKGEVNAEEFEKAINGGSYESYNDSVVENYYYRYLYKQQDVPQHLLDAKNKAGIQILKKLIDNPHPETMHFVNDFFKNYCANIKDSFSTLLVNMGWKINADGSITNRFGDADNLNFEEFWKKARVEAQRLGMDSNFIEYLTVDHLGKPIMPNWFNVASSKLENIAQAIFNSAITRQTLPGWHAAQVTSVGHGAKVLDSTGKFRTLRYHPENEDGSGNEAYMEVLLPRWDSRIPKPKTEEEERALLKKLETEGIDIHLGYRIPTEGKQSVSIMKVVGFLDDVYGSTIMVPDEWVTQTGSDFDVDSVYGISFKTYIDKDKNIRKIKLDLAGDIDSVKRRYEYYVKDQVRIIKQRKDEEANVSQDLKRTKISKQSFIEQIEDLYKELFDSSNLEKDDKFEELAEESSDLWGQLPIKLKYAIHNSNTKLKAKESIIERYMNIVSLCDKYLNKGLDKELHSVILEYRDINDAILQILTKTSENYKEFIAEFRSAKTNKYKEIIEAHRQEHFNKVQKVANQLGIVSFEDFATWDPVEQNSRDARNNQILEDLLSIMQHPSSREENYSRSNFDLLTKGKNIGDDLRGANSVTRSPYNPLDQIDFMENAISGRELKAMSVNRDTFASVCNKVKPRFSEDRAITIVYNAAKYDKALIEETFKDDAYDKPTVKEKDGKIYVTHNRLGWSNNNRNVVGQLITTYTSQTTAHILDAIKEGTIFNENKYTFGAFKTLVDVGVDYDTAIPLLMQPSVTELVSVYHETNSIYIGGNVNIPRVALNRIAKKYGVTIDGLEISDWDSSAKVLNAIKQIDGFNEVFVKLFGKTIDANLKLNEQQFIIDSDLLKDRLNSSGIFTDALTRFAFDVGNLLTFNKLVDTSKHIDTLVKCVKPDKFGALQTIFGTKSILDEIKAIVKLSDKPIANVLTVNGNNFIKAIYPGIENGNIDVEASAYPYLAAFLKYATAPSVNINSQLFFTESYDFYCLVSEAQKRLGRKFTEEEHKKFVQYVITTVYNKIPILVKPQTLDKNHQFIEDIDRAGENEADEIAKEYVRIFGYNTTEVSNLEVSDINYPTEEDIKRFNKLTPLQKVVWMQQNFNENSGICDFLKTNFFNQKELTETGISHQTIRFTDQFDDIENLYISFDKTFFNKNPFARLTALDLIKYSFIVEGFKFKKGSISKIVPNKTLYTDINKRGTGIVEAAELQLYEGISPINYPEIIDKFVRSHSELIRTIRINKSIKDPINARFNASRITNKVNDSNDAMYYISFTSENENLLNHLGIYENDSRKYIKIKRGKNTILYKVVLNGDKGFYLYPINLLEQTEVVDYSYNDANNKFFISAYYDRLISEHKGETEAYITIADGNVIKKIKEDYGIEKRSIKYVNGDLGNINKIEELRTSGTQIEQSAADKFIKDALKVVNSPVEGGSVVNRFVHNSDIIGKLFTQNVPVVQAFSIDENTSKKVCITKVQLSKNARTQIRKYFDNNKNISKYDLNKIPESERYIAEEVRKSGLINSIIYKVEEVLEDDDIRASATESIDFEEELDFAFTDSPTYLTANDIVYQLEKEAKESNAIASDILSSLHNSLIDFDSAKSIWDNKKNIYVAAAEFYTRKANKLLSQINEFTTSNGDIFRIDDERLYTEWLPNHPEDYQPLVKIILECKTFGKALYEVFNLDLVGEDAETSRAIQTIRKAINKIRDNEVINGKNGAINRLFNDYIAQEFSTNPLVKEGFVKLKDTFGDTDRIDFAFSDIEALNHKQVQTVIKYTMSILNAATQVNAPNAVEEFVDKYDEILKEKGDFDFKHIMPTKGQLITEYNQSFLDDRQKVIDKVKTEAAKGIDRVEYYKAILERDEWFSTYTHQPLVPEYYQVRNNLLRHILKVAPELYVEYRRLERELYNHDLNDDKHDEQQRRRQINLKIQQLYSLVKEDGSPKDDIDRIQASALGNYISGMKALNQTYYKYDEKQGFRESLEYYLNVIKTYERKNPHTTLDIRLKDDNYREAYDWIQQNTHYSLNEEAKAKLNAAYAALGDKDHTSSAAIRAITEKAYDAYGNIDPRELPIEDILKIKQITEDKYNKSYNHYLSDDVLVKEIPADRPILSSEFYQSIKTDIIPNEERTKIIKEINEIVRDYRDPITGQFDTVSLIKNLSVEDRTRLVSLYTKLRHIKKSKKEIESSKKFLGKVKAKTNVVAFTREYAKAKNELTDKKLLSDWLAIFVEHDKDGNIIFDDNGDYVPARNVYGYYEVKDKKYIDYDKTNAIKLLNESVRYVETEYYYAAMQEAIENGTYKEWYDNNHVFNTYTRKMEPLKIWTKMEVIPNAELDVSYTYLPTYDNAYKHVRDGKINGKDVAEEPDFRNPEWKPNSTNYKAIDPKVKQNIKTIKDYDNEQYHNLTPKERKMLELLQSTINKYTVNNPNASESMKRFVAKGYMPRKRKEIVDAKYWIKQATGLLGWTSGRVGESDWTRTIDYTDRQAIDFPMLQIIKDKLTKEYIRVEPQGNRTDEEYREYVNQVNEENRKIKEHNLKIDNELLDDDWRTVMQDFIQQAVVYNAKMDIRDTLYLTLEDIKSTKAYDISSYNKNLMRDKKRSTREDTQYQQIEQRRTADLLENQIRRIIYGQFRQNSRFNKYADVLQNVTSAKYMLLNITGAAANIGTGKTNIFNEVFARQFFDYKTFNQARRQYGGSIPSIVMSTYGQNVDNFTAAIIKTFDIVDFDEIRQHRSNTSIHETVKNVRDLGYGLHSAGEHYMQNVVLLSMLKSHRVVKVGDKYRVMNFSEYTQQLEMDTLKGLLKDDAELSKLYAKFIRDIKRDINKVKDYDSFKYDVVADFLKTYVSKDLTKKYIKLRDEALKTAKEEFEKNPTYESKFTVKNGRAVLIDDGTTQDIQFGEFKERVQNVNKYIHGVYDKIGAANIQKEWWGGLLMQYHKHIYPGIMKRFRAKGYYNEIRGSIEQGTYITLANYLSTEFKGIGDKISSKTENGENIVLASIQEIIKAAIDTVLNLGFNYQRMSGWQKDNLRRILGDLMGITASMLLAIAIHLGADDDEIEESDELSTILYIADRLNSESQMYTPWGLYAEASTLWSSPVASMTAPADLLKGLGIVTKYLFNDDFNINYTTGLYKGQNKLAVLVYRNTPIYRNINRILHMKENNSYYRINETALNIKLAKNIASIIKED